MQHSSSAIEPAQLSSLIGDIYECALEPARWNDTLTQFVSLFSPPDWDVAALMWEGMNCPGVRWVGTTGLVAHALQGYEMVFAGTNVWSTRASHLTLGEVYDTDQILSRAEFLKSDLYQKFLKTWRMELAMFVIFERANAEQLALAMPGPADRNIEHLRRGIRLIAPHVQRTMRISHGLVAANLRAAAAEAALNLGHVAVMAVDANLNIVSRNEKADRLADLAMFAMRNAKLAFADADAQRKITALAAQDAPGSEAFRIEAADGENYAVLAMNIRPHRQPVLGGWAEGAKLVIAISLPHTAPLIEVNRLKAWFDLTASEARLVVALASGQTLAQYAAERGVSVEAARFLVKSAFRKTGAASQTQLVTIVKQVPQG